jgi:hypothetical protein
MKACISRGSDYLVSVWNLPTYLQSLQPNDSKLGLDPSNLGLLSIGANLQVWRASRTWCRRRLSCAGPGFLPRRSSTMLRAPLWPSRSWRRSIRASRLRLPPGSSLLLSWSMRILLDENAPANLKSLLIGYEVPIVPERGYADVSKGKLLDSAKAAGFQLLLTADSNIRAQQRMVGRRLAMGSSAPRIR